MPPKAKAAPKPAKKTRDHVFLVDGSSYIFRAYFAMFKAAQSRGKAFTRSDGLPVGAVMTFCNMLWKLLRDGLEGVKPSHVGVVFDYAGESFRNEIYAQYKAHRDEPPEDLVPQFPLMRDAVKAFGLTPIEEKGFEADDLIATYARSALAEGADVTIVAGDKDMMQLIRPGVAMYDPMPGRERWIGPKEVQEKFGVGPEKVAEVQALAGDSTDNVPGVPGIGIKTAAALIQEYGDLETLLFRAGEIKQEKRRQSLIEFAEQARISKKLVLLDDKAPVHIALKDLHIDGVEPKRLVAFLKAMEFNTLTKRVAEAGGVDAEAIEADAKLKAGSGAAAALKAKGRAEIEGKEAPEEASLGAAPSSAPAREADEFIPAALVAARAREAHAKFDRTRYETVTDLARLDFWIAKATELGVVAVDTETTSLDAMQCELCGASLSVAPNEACYIPFGHKLSDDLLSGGGLVAGQIPIKEGLARLKTLLENPAVLKVGQNVKFDYLVLSRHGIETTPFDDTMLMSYALDAGKNSHGMDTLSEKHLGHKPISYSEVTGKGKSSVCFDRVDLARATEYAAEDADVTLRLWRLFKARLVAEGMDTVYETLERPLVRVLAHMEKRGIAIDRALLAKLSGEFAQTAARAEKEIAKLAGEDFNPGSAKQLGDILFGKMGLPGGTKTATGAWSTRANVLEDLAEEGHELPQKILEWRSLTKLKSTYTDALPTFVNPETHRVHTSYALASTPTGRLSSSDPNLQNIPIRTEEGRKIRRAFVAEKGMKLVSADYSQIELRLLAEIADIPQLKKAFSDELDIHAMTASEMFGVPIKGMPPEVRRRAKAINFGIIYGISAFGLANQLSIPREEAGAYIKKYFERFPGIREYMEETKAFCKKHGYVTTLFGRRAYYPSINDNNPSMRGFMERAAINARLQGTAADIIRRAMIRMEGALAKAKLSGRMLLQVHDELVFEVPEKEVEKTLPVIAKVMIEAPLPAVSLSVPLHVDARAADNWDEAH
ncbi:MAG TPA: DNA polymerase I [Xanthobacteraceae bacterium]|nr:DNA polymerase I [Xanthobacteraceae bacterium]